MTWQWQYTSTANSAVNLAPTTGSWAVYYLKEALKQAGWTVKMSSDGSTYNATGDQITTGTSGAGGMGNASAWFRIQSPAGAGGREFTFQRTSDTNWRIKFSHSAGFSGGSPGTTQTPSATDEKILLGAGTDAAPTYAAWLSTNATYHVHIGTDTSAPYGWYMINPQFGTNQMTNWMYFAPMQQGTYDTDDVAPYVVTVKTSSTPTGSTLSDYTTGGDTGYGGGMGYVKKGQNNEAWLQFAACTYYMTSGGNQLPDGTANGFGLDPYSGGLNILPILVARRSGAVSTGYGSIKGWIDTAMMGWRTFSTQYSSVGDVGTRRYIFVGDLAFRFPTGVAAVL